MKLLRYGPEGAEKPGILDAEGQIRDLSGIVPDIGGTTLIPDGLAKIAEIDVSTLPVVADT
ncbi:2-hydroxyhepta-2,4-diene-1,7-dioate isomerase, partial [Marinovum sp. 1_MG-2023]|nr:2-hydroxyhepta-2,4-diene-1,7-dioate isomerase [Marinovum sp. 1_MG-2023]